MTRPAWCLGWVLLAAACGARTPLDVAPPAPSDAGPAADAGPRRDAGPRDAGPPPDAGPRIACARRRDCTDGLVCAADPRVPPADLAPLGLACGRWGAAEAGSACTDGPECLSGICLVSGTCADPCVDDSDCREICSPAYARTASNALQPLRACVQSFSCPPDITVVGTDRQPISGPIARDTLTLDGPLGPDRELWVLLSEPAAPLVVWSMRSGGAAGRTLFDLETIGPGSPPPINPVSFIGEPVTVLVPNGSRSAPSPSGLVLEVEGFSGGEVEITHLARTGMPASTIDVDVWYVGASGLAPGPSPPRAVVEALAEVGRVYATSGIRIGDVRQHAVVGALRDRYAIIEEDPGTGEMPELADLMRLSAGVNRPSVNIYLVRQMERALGSSGGIPGSWCRHGTGGSGLAISYDLLAMSGISLGRAIAHELGHYLGLFHTTEAEGSQVESLDDTPMCPISRDADGDGFLLDFECRGAGAENLMFWAASGETLSSEQFGVMRSAFVLR